MQFDLMIIGGGMVGAALACALKQSDLRIALVDAAPFNVSNDHRLIALNDNSVCLLKNLNLWPALQASATPIKQVHVSKRGQFGITRISADEFDLDTLGHVVPANVINTALYSELNNASNITLLKPAKLQKLTVDNEYVSLTIEMDHSIVDYTAKNVIGADGSYSLVRELLNMDVEKIDYQQSAIVTCTDLKRDHNNIAYERFLKTGAIAMLPLGGQQVATIWTDQNDIIEKLMQLDDQAFLQELQKNVGYRLGQLQKISKRYIYPLHRLQVKQQSQDHVLLMGNAAHTLHPIAAQGLNLAFYEIAAFVENFLEKNTLTLEGFGSTRQQFVSRQLSHHLPSLFSSDFFLVTAARQFSMMSLDMCYPLKKCFTDYVMGRAGRMPKLLLRI